MKLSRSGLNSSFCNCSRRSILQFWAAMLLRKCRVAPLCNNSLWTQAICLFTEISARNPDILENWKLTVLKSLSVYLNVRITWRMMYDSPHFCKIVWNWDWRTSIMGGTFMFSSFIPKPTGEPLGYTCPLTSQTMEMINIIRQQNKTFTQCRNGGLKCSVLANRKCVFFTITTFFWQQVIT